MKLRKLFLLAVSALVLSGCGSTTNPEDHSTTESSSIIDSSSVEPEKSQVYVLPTTRGEKYLRNSSSRKALADIRKDDTDDSYHMVIDQSAIDGKNARFHDSGQVAYNANDIDVLLFGIGTNFNNSASADTLLYASLDETSLASDEVSIDVKNNADSGDSQSIVTGVSYDYGTGPLQYNTSSEQLVWLKTTVMENKGGVYVASPTVDIRYTPVYVQFADTVAPVMNDLQISVSYSNYLSYLDKGYTTVNWVKMLVSENMNASSKSLIDTDEAPTLKDVVLSEEKASYAAGNVIEGTYTAKDSSGNVSSPSSFAISIYKDYANDVAIELPYRELTNLSSATEREDLLKSKYLHGFKDNANTLDVAGKEFKSRLDISNVAFFDYDEIDAALLDIKDNVVNKTKIVIDTFVDSYGSGSLTVSLVDTYSVKSVTLNPSNRASIDKKLKDAETIDSFAKIFAGLITEIKDDFEDTYTLQLVLKYYTDSQDNEYYSFAFYVVDSSENTKLTIDGNFPNTWPIYQSVVDLLGPSSKKVVYNYTIFGEPIEQ